MKARIFPRIFLPVTLLLLALLLACQQDSVAPTPPPASPLPSAAQTARPLTAGEREAIADFTQRYESLAQDWASLRSDFDGWRSGLAECHPSAAQAALQHFAASFKEVTGAARNLPRTASTRELADLIIPAAEAEESALRALRDRWQPGSLSYFEAVERQRTAASGAQDAAEDRAQELRQEFEAGPTAAEVKEAEQFLAVFEEIEHQWQEYHDEYRKLRNKEAKLDVEEVASAYTDIAGPLFDVLLAVSELERTEVLQDLIETLRDAADDEYDALEALVEALEKGIAEPAPPIEIDSLPVAGAAPAAPPGAGAAMIAPPPLDGENAPPAGEGAPPAGDGGPAQPQAPGQEQPPGSGEAGAPVPPATAPPGVPVMPGNLPPAASPAPGNGETGIFHQELDAAYLDSIAALEEVSAGIGAIIEDTSAKALEDLADFDEAHRALRDQWDSFHQDYDHWRNFDGGCDRIAVLEELDGFSQQAAALAAGVRGLPRTGFLLPVYSLAVDAAQREADAMRALYNSWRPFSVDAFAAVEQERTNADRLQQQAVTGLEELTARP